MKKDFQKLYAEQDIILDLLVRNGIDLVLSGGTALHRFHLKEKYRYSEDLDFFTQTDMKECMEFIEAIKQNKIPYKITNNAETLKQLIVFDNLKIELMQDVSYNKPSPVKTQKGFLVDSVETILSNKFECIYNRDEPRDLFDIYCIINFLDANIEIAFDGLIERTNILGEEVIEKLIHYPPNFLQQERILIKDEEIYNNFLKEYSILFRNTFVGFIDTNTNRMS
ncbi:nucleotidyl transferase AbiEii/AbiGii toxin family protein [Helicobacter pullorum]|uniref:Nucleotidyl transferase of uncharacterized function (DUF1814) n=1 Tax=Helicobacter pullorum TaxID=35818 RepID=A0A377Q319_9HELI|nr:nucleotidyl transferase AbiEii/AbiGii toxin family protein [Helicobacter pullorum]STQ88969.1 Nucleotidyl transferase of uncharacterised function (DUF1814) [Helicobacter pullorum]